MNKRDRLVAWLVAVAAVAWFVSALWRAQDEPPRAEPPGPSQLQDACAAIQCGRSWGSGVLFDRDGSVYMLTAAHVIEAACGNAASKPVVVMHKPTRFWGLEAMIERTCVVLEASMDEDIAILRVEGPGFQHSAAVLCERPIVVGDPLWLVSSPYGRIAANSVVEGVVSYIGRERDGVDYDQTSCPAMPGSSGGGVFSQETGECVGIVTRGLGSQYNLYVPARRIRFWLEREGFVGLVTTGGGQAGVAGHGLKTPNVRE